VRTSEGSLVDFCVATKPDIKVITLGHAQNALAMEEFVKLFSTAFVQVCALKEADKFVVNSLITS
jgi:hypothetical protein